jgi:hypothetical protein
MRGNPGGYRGRCRIIITIRHGLIFWQEIPPKNRLKNQRRSVAKKPGHLQPPEIITIKNLLDRRNIGCPLSPASTEPRGRKTHEILGDGASGDFAAGGDLSLGQMAVEKKTQHFTDLSHGQPRGRHGTSSNKF